MLNSRSWRNQSISEVTDTNVSTTGALISDTTIRHVAFANRFNKLENTVAFLSLQKLNATCSHRFSEDFQTHSGILINPLSDRNIQHIKQLEIPVVQQNWYWAICNLVWTGKLQSFITKTQLESSWNQRLITQHVLWVWFLQGYFL